LIEDAALDLVGRLEIVPLPGLAPPENARNEVVATAESLRALRPRRNYGAYKNQFHRIGVVAGSKGFVGAALLTTTGALRAGAGLVEVFVPEEIYSIVAAAAPQEAMVKPIRSYRALLDDKHVEIWALGPGLGQSNSGDLLKLIERDERPMIVDADGLNILATNIDILKQCRGRRLLTPHPGEMKRLLDPGRMSRAGTARNFCDQFKVTLLYKGSRTIVTERDRPLSYNTTGNPGMASGGMGDVLTGVCAGLVGQNLTLYDAARVGAWACGRAAELAVFSGQSSEQSLLATDVLNHLGGAFNDLQAQ
jgi:ADP-dependent NAD(P)H-hydrate dehydratase / NAD(P)H-hydrate epimerase